MSLVATCEGTPGQVVASDGSYVATCSNAVVWADYGSFWNSNVDPSQAGQLWSGIIFALVLAWGIKFTARRFRKGG